MGSEVIMLASKYEAEKQQFPAYVSEKLDGVAADFFFCAGSGWQVQTRQGKPLYSVDHIIEWLNANWTEAAFVGLHLVGELYIPGMPFKDISGLVRKKERSDETDTLRLYIYDMFNFQNFDLDFQTRWEYIHKTYITLPVNGPVRLVQQWTALASDDVSLILGRILKGHQGAEGVVIRQLHGDASKYEVGKRPRGMAKYKFTETVDLPLIGVEEAIDGKTGEQNGMAGRLIVKYNDMEIGVGPGKLTHPERIHLLQNFNSEYKGKIIEVAYMPDPSYEALREPRFIRFRPDKD